MKTLDKIMAILLIFASLVISVSQVAEAQTPTPVTVPAPLSPANGAVLTVTTPTFTWSAVTGSSPPILYDLQVASSSAMANPLINKTNIATNTYTLSGAETLASGTYWWQVRARDSATPAFNYSGWSSPAWSLSINAAPAPTPAPTPTPTPAPTPAPVPPARPQLHGFFGLVKAVSTAALTMDTRGQRGETRDIEMLITSDTRIMAPPVQAASTGYITVGARLAVLASLSEGRYTALQIVIIPAHPVKKHIQGLVMEVKDTQVTLMERNGKVFTLQLAQGVASPAVGQFIIATAEENPVTKDLRLLAFEISDKLLEKLEKHIGKIEGKKSKDEEEEKGKGKDLDKLENLLNRNADRHLQTLERVLEKAPDQAKPALKGVIEKAKDRKEDIKDKIEKRKGKDGPKGPPSGRPGKSGKGHS